MATVDGTLNIARSQLGYGVPGPPRYSKYGEWAGANPAPYCDFFVSWVFDQAGGLNFGKQGYCPSTVQYWKNKGRLYATPQAGDQVLYFWNGVYAHTGLVERVDGDYIVTIEGNTAGDTGSQANGGYVLRKRRLWVGTRAVFGRPEYVAPPAGITPDYNPPLHINAVSGVGDATAPGGWILQNDGAIFSFGGAPYQGAANGQAYWVPRTAKQLQAKDNGGYRIVAVESPPGTGYDYPGGGNIVADGPIFSPPVVLNIVSTLNAPGGGFWVLQGDGSIFTFGNAQYHGGMNGSPDFAGRTAAHLEQNGAGYNIIDTANEKYQFPA